MKMIDVNGDSFECPSSIRDDGSYLVQCGDILSLVGVSGLEVVPAINITISYPSGEVQNYSLSSSDSFVFFEEGSLSVSF